MWFYFLPAASIAANFRSICGSERRAPECNTHRSPTAEPHVGQGTEDSCLGLSSFLFIYTNCITHQPRIRPILHTRVFLGLLRLP